MEKNEFIIGEMDRFRYVFCYSRGEFEAVCKERGWDDNNIPPDKAFISICGTEDVCSQVIGESEPHYFSDGHKEVLNLNFDDIPCLEEFIDDKGLYIAWGINRDQAEQVVRFIDENIYTKDILVHCRAGQSRSQAVVSYILWLYGSVNIFDEIVYRKDNPPIYPNQFVLQELKTAARRLGIDVKISFRYNGYPVESFTTTVEEDGKMFFRIKVKDHPEYIFDPKNREWIFKNGKKECHMDDWEFWLNFK